MQATGIICEYNPFHSGHARLLRLATEKTSADLVVCVMSGEFTQRGEPAICSKWKRTRMALLGGADVVVELPVIFAAASAERFAKGAVRLLSAMGVHRICFGAESADEAALLEAAALLNEESPKFRAILHDALDRGASYAAARRSAAEMLCPGMGKLLRGPNNLLGIEYIRAALADRLPVQFVPVRRDGSGHDGSWEPGQHPSASALRHALMSASPEECEEICRRGGIPCTVRPVLWKEPLYTLLAGKFRTADAAAFEDTADSEPGLSERLIECARGSTDFDEMIAMAASKRYPAARVRRVYLNGLLGIQKSLLKRAAKGDIGLYAHVLGVRRNALEAFAELCRASQIPVASSPKKLPANDLLKLDLAASDLYGLLMRPVRKAGTDYTARLLVL